MIDIYRENFNTKHFFLSMNDEELIIKPVLEKQKLDPDLKDFYEALGDIKNGNVTSYNNIDEFEKAFI